MKFASFFICAVVSADCLSQTCSVEIANPAGKLSSPYVGECANGLANGKGEYAFTVSNPTNPSLTITVRGDFQNGKLEGNGTTDSSDGTKSEGQWSQNKPHGQGKWIGPSYEFEGQFLSGKRWNGIGTHKAEGTVIAGYRIQNGEQTVLCRVDKKDTGCSATERNLLLKGSSKGSPPDSGQLAAITAPQATASRQNIPGFPFAASGKFIAEKFVLTRDADGIVGLLPCNNRITSHGVVYREYGDKVDWNNAQSVRSATEELRDRAVKASGCVLQPGARDDSLWIIVAKAGMLQDCDRSGAANCFDRAQSWAMYRAVAFSRDGALRPSLYGSQLLLASAAREEAAAKEKIRLQQEATERAQVLAATERNATENQKREKTQAFADKYSASDWLNTQKVVQNPFMFEGKVFLIKARLDRFTSRDTAIFSSGDLEGFICNGIAATAYTADSNRVLMAVKVIGTGEIDFWGGKTTIPRVQHLGHAKCLDASCEDFANTFKRR